MSSDIGHKCAFILYHGWAYVSQFWNIWSFLCQCTTQIGKAFVDLVLSLLLFLTDWKWFVTDVLQNCWICKFLSLPRNIQKNYSSSSDRWSLTSIDSVWTVAHIVILDSLDKVSFFLTNIVVGKKGNRLTWLKLNEVFYANQPYYITVFHYNILYECCE